MSSRTAVETLVWLIEDAFRGDPDQSLLANLRDLRETDWTALPGGGRRSIAEVLEHVGWSKWMYEDYAFGHDFYHAGEINHIRALLQGTDRWPY